MMNLRASMFRTLPAWSAVAVTLAISTIGCSQGAQNAAAPAQQASDIPKIDFEKYTLANGLDVILSEDHRLPMVAVNLWYHVGPANEEAGRTGFAHLFEHMMFQGSKHVPGDTHFRVARGRRRQQHQRHHRLRSHQLLRDAAVEPARARRCGSSPIAWATCSTCSIRPTSRTSRTSSATSAGRASRTSRTASSKKRCSTSCFRRCIRTTRTSSDRTPTSRRRSSRTSRTSSSCTTRRTTRAWRSSATSTRPRPRRWSRNISARFKKGDAGAEAVDRDAEDHRRAARGRAGSRRAAARLHGVDHARRSIKPGDADADIASTILGGGKSSRLYKTLVYEKQIAQDVSAQQQSLLLGSVFTIEATARPGHTAEELEKAIDEELGEAPRRRAGADRSGSRAQRASRRASFRGSRTWAGSAASPIA